MALGTVPQLHSTPGPHSPADLLGAQPAPIQTTERILLLANAPSILQQEVSNALRADGYLVTESFRGDLDLHHHLPSQTLLLSLSSERSEASAQERYTNQLSHRLDRLWMPATIIHDHLLVVGPAFTPGLPLCYECARVCIDARLKNPTVDKRPVAQLSPTQAAFAGAVISASVAATLKRIDVNLKFTGHPNVLLYDLETLSSSPVLVSRMPGCYTCWPSRSAEKTSTSPGFSLPALFENCSRAKTADYLTNPVPRQFTNTSNASQPRAYPHSIRIPLPVWSDLHAAKAQPPAGILRLQQLSTLLFLTFGRWNKADAKRPDRLLPSAGNLGSPSAFVIVSKAEGLDPGVYFYSEESHSLARLDGLFNTDVDELLADYTKKATGVLPGALLVLIGSYNRIAVKYGAFGYRLVHFDSGLRLQHLQEVAQALRLQPQDMSSWPDAMLSTALNLNPGQDPITGVLALSDGNAAPASPSQQTSAPATPRQNQFEKPDLSFPTAAMLVNHIHSLSRQQLPHDWTGCHQSAKHQETPATISPLSETSIADHWNFALTRRSVHVLENRPVPAKIVKAILEGAVSRADAPRIETLATIRNFSAPATSWETSELSLQGQLVSCVASETTGSLKELFVDPVFADAPLIFWVCAEITRDPWHYRRTLLEAGRVTYSLMQGLDKHTLRGTPVAGIWPERVAEVLGIRSCENSPLLAFICGFTHHSRSGE